VVTNQRVCVGLRAELYSHKMTDSEKEHKKM